MSHYHPPSPISLVIPIYNEAQIIEENTSRLIKYLDGQKIFKNYEIIFVDNGSTDNSFYKISLLVNHPQIRVLRTTRRGLGLALKRGLKTARYQNIIFYAIDLPFGFSFIHQALQTALLGHELVLGSKGHPASQLNRLDKTRIVINQVYNWLTRKLFRLEIRDTQGAFLIKKRLLQKIDHHLASASPWFQAQLAIYSHLKGAKIKEIPISISRPSRPSKMKIRDGLIFLIEMLKELPKYYWSWGKTYYQERKQKSHILKKINFYLLIILLAAAVLRFYKLGDFPPIFYHDEAAKGYNAYSLLKTGKTFRGLSWPLYFTDFSDILPSTAIIYNYSAIPSVDLLGLNKTATRLPAAIFGTLTVFILYRLTKTIFHKQSIALLTALFLAISPWHIYMSRYALEPVTFPFFFLLGWSILQKAIEKKPLYLPMAMVPLAICLYSYRTALLFIPLFLLSYSFIYKKFFLERKRLAFLSLGVFLLISFPLIYLYLTKLNQMAAYYQRLSIYSLPRQQVSLFLNSYFGHFLLSFWIYLLPIVVFFFLGFYWLIKESRHIPTIQALMAGLLLVVVPPSLVLNWLVPSPTRSIGMTGFLEMLAAYGLLKLLPRLNYLKKPFLVFLSCFSLINGVMLAKYVFPKFFYPVFVWDPGSEELAQYINEVEGQYQKIFITNKANQPFIYLLFFNKYPPREFLQGEVKRHYRGALEFVDSFDKYIFCDISECWQPNPNYLFVGRTDDLPNWPAKLYIEKEGVKYFKVLEDAQNTKS